MTDDPPGRRRAAPADREALRRRVRHPYITRQTPEGAVPQPPVRPPGDAAGDRCRADAPD